MALCISDIDYNMQSGMQMKFGMHQLFHLMAKIGSIPVRDVCLRVVCYNVMLFIKNYLPIMNYMITSYNRSRMNRAKSVRRIVSIQNARLKNIRLLVKKKAAGMAKR